MALTEKLDIPVAPRPKEGWSTRLLFPGRAAASAIGKVFVSPFDVLLAFITLTLGVVETIGDAPWLFYAFAILLLGAAVFDRAYNNAHLFAKKTESKPEVIAPPQK